MMNCTTGMFVAVNLLGGPPSRPPFSPDLFSLIAATSNAGDGFACWPSTSAAAIVNSTPAVSNRPAAYRRIDRMLHRANQFSSGNYVERAIRLLDRPGR